MDFYNQVEQPARVRMTNQTSMPQPIDIHINDRPVIRGLAQRAITQYMPFPSGNYNIKIYSDNQLLASQNVLIEGSQLITITSENNRVVIRVTEDLEQVIPGMPQQGMITPFEFQQGQMGMPQAPMGPQMGMPQAPMGLQIGMPQPQMNLPQGGNVMPQCGTPYNQGQYPQMWQQYQQQPQIRDFEAQGRARIRFIHLSPNAPAVDITTPEGTVLFSNVPYRAVSDYITIAPGTYTLQVRPAGMDRVILTIPNIVINPNDVRSLYAIGILNGSPALEVVILDDTLAL